MRALELSRIGAMACVVVGVIGISAPAQAQFGNLFGQPAPRPPGSVPGGERVIDPEEEDVPELPSGPGRVLPAPARPSQPQQGFPQQGGSQQQGFPQQQPGQRVPAPGGVQSQPLPPPPGQSSQPQQGQNNQPGQPPLTGLPPGQRQPRGNPQDNAAIQPGDEVVVEPPAQKIPNKRAVFSGLDKITGRIINFDVEMNETVQFGALRVTPRACYTRPPTEATNTDGFVEVDEITLKGEVKRIFSGWMFATSPGLHAVEHSIYDVWLTDCKEPDKAVADKGDEQKSQAAPSPRPRQNSKPAPANPNRGAQPAPARNPQGQAPQGQPSQGQPSQGQNNQGQTTQQPQRRPPPTLPPFPTR